MQVLCSHTPSLCVKVEPRLCGFLKVQREHLCWRQKRSEGGWSTLHTLQDNERNFISSPVDQWLMRVKRDALNGIEKVIAKS